MFDDEDDLTRFAMVALAVVMGFGLLGGLAMGWLIWG